MSRPNFIDARMAYIEERARSGGNPPTREELAAFYDGWHASQSLSPEDVRASIIEECAQEAEDRVTCVAVGVNKQYWNGRDDAAALIRALKSPNAAGGESK